MNRDSFTFYRSFYEGIKELSAEEKTLVIQKIMQYQFEEQNEQNIELSGISKAIFDLIKLQLDRENLAYENGKKGGRPKTTLLTTLSAKKEEKEKNQKKKKKEIYIYPPISPQGEFALEDKSICSSSQEKIHFAEFVAMTNAEHEKLCSTYGKEFTDQCIETLDNYKGASGKKYKSDYRAILNWVVNRVKQNNPSFQSKQNSGADEIDKIKQQAMRDWGML